MHSRICLLCASLLMGVSIVEINVSVKCVIMIDIAKLYKKQKNDSYMKEIDYSRSSTNL